MGTINYGELAAEAAKGNEPIPAAKYDAEVTAAESKTSKNGNPYYRICFTVADGPHRGRQVWTNVTLNASNPASASFFFGKMAALGLNASFFATVPGENSEAFICQALLARKAEIDVSLGEPYNGTVRNEIDGIKALGNQAPAAVAAELGPESGFSATGNPAASSTGLPPGI